MSEHNKPTSSTSQDSSNTEFEHLGNTSNVASKKRHHRLMGAVVLGIAAMVLAYLLFSGNSAPNKPAPVDPSSSANLTVLQENAKRLAESERQGNVPMHAMPTMVLQQTLPHNDSKAYVARRNAPTQMYNAAQMSGQTRASNSGSSATLVGKNDFARFANGQRQSVSTVTATTMAHPYDTIAEGEFIHAVLETAINSDMPGMVRAVITRPVYAYQGERPLIPAGSRLVGQYTSLNSNGAASTRVFVIWNRIITPNGLSMIINSPGSDALGRAGMGANAVDTHFFKKFGTAALLSVMGAYAGGAGVNSTAQPNSANAYRQAMAESFQQASQSSVEGNLGIRPTIHVYQGSAVTVFVAHDVDLYTALGASS